MAYPVDESGLVHGCYKDDGTFKVLTDTHPSLPPGFTALTFSVTGPQGPAGADGAQGPQGDVGPQGPPGPGPDWTFFKTRTGMGSPITNPETDPVVRDCQADAGYYIVAAFGYCVDSDGLWHAVPILMCHRTEGDIWTHYSLRCYQWPGTSGPTWWYAEHIEAPIYP